MMDLDHRWKWALVGAILIHALIPHYIYIPMMGSSAVIRVSRWSGVASRGAFYDGFGWVSVAEHKQEMEELPLTK